MASEIVMPKLSDTMTEGQLSAWRKSVGERIERGDIIAEVETDKAVMDLESFTAGILLEQRVGAGELVPVGTVIGLIGEAGEVLAPRPAVAVTLPAVDASATPPAPASEESPAIPGSGAAAAASPFERSYTGKSQAAPIVRRRAAELGIDLDQVQGSGPSGRIMLEDLEKMPPTAAGSISVPEAPQQVAAPGSQPLSRMGSAIARIVSASWRDIPHFSVTMEIRMDTAEEVRRELKANNTPVSLNELVMKGAAVALTSHPTVNASLIDGSIVLHQEVNIGFMTKVEGGLLVPVIRGCEALSLAEIAARSRSLIEQARKGTISEAELTGGTFSVSNLGAYGVSQFSAIILPPQAAILAVGAVTDRLVPGKGGALPARIMKATLSGDHRVLDGVAAAEFLRELKQILENPVRMLV